MTDTFTDALRHTQERITRLFKQYLPDVDTHPQSLYQAIHYSVLNGGKRLRPFLLYSTGKILNITPQALDHTAMAIELIHCYSLIHDDLPCMDNDTLRRGKPTCHIAFSEATALLAGDALQTLAFELLIQNPYLSNTQKIHQLAILSKASGAAGMVGGQAIDLSVTGKQMTLTELEQMHRAKTGALIRAAVNLACITQYAQDSTPYQALDQYAALIGLAFQIQDDILDIEGDTAILGKPQGSDNQLHKPTWPALAGMRQAKKMARRFIEQAIEQLQCFSTDTSELKQLALYIIHRNQ